MTYFMRDSDVRAAVCSALNKQYAGDSDTRILEEMGIWSGSVRIDIAVINGELSGLELKSERDTLKRLPFQAELYSRVFDRVTLVVGERHAQRAQTMVPEWWGITIAKSEKRAITLTDTRKSQRNPSPDPYLVAQLLWKDEALAVLERYDLAKGWRGKRVREIHERLANELPFDELTAQIRQTLKARTGWLRQVGPNQFDMPVHTNLNPSF